MTCCNGQIYGLCTNGHIGPFVIRVDIVVKDREVVITLLAFGVVPNPLNERRYKRLHFLTGSRTELFYIAVLFHRKTDKTPREEVILFKCDMTSINRKELECLKIGTLTNEKSNPVNTDKWEATKDFWKEWNDKIFDYLDDLEITEHLWEEVKDLKEGMFFVDLAHDNYGFYNPAIGSKVGGFIYIYDKVDKLIYSYHLNNKTIVPFPVPFSVFPTSHMSMWECWLEDDHSEAEFTVDSKQQEDKTLTTLATNNEVEVSRYPLLDVPFDILELIMKFCAGVEYMNFRATCKRCYLTAPLIQ